MKITAKFSYGLAVVFIVGLVVAGAISYSVLQKNAREEVITRAGLMMDAAIAIRGYTINEIRPLLKPLMVDKFLPQTVPAYAATKNFEALREKNPDYHYKEATINPTNPRNKATDWENDIIMSFKDDPSLKEIIGERETPTGRSLYFARPIRIKNEACLSCHGLVADAPATMLALYGDVNGFGWKHNEVIGSQMVSVPMSVPVEKANSTFIIFMSSLVVIFIVIYILINFMLRKMVVNPVNKMVRLADQISHGDMNHEGFEVNGKDEISDLGRSFERMRVSLKKAMSMLEK